MQLVHGEAAPARGRVLGGLSADHDRIDQHLKIRVPVRAGPHELGVTFLKKPSSLLETARQPYQAHFNLHRHPRIQPAVYSVSIIGPYGASGPGDTPSRRRIFVIAARESDGDEDAAARRILTTLMRRAYRRPVDRRRPSRAARALPEGTRRRRASTPASRWRCRAVLVSPQFLFRVEQDPAGVAAGHAVSHQRPRARVAAVVLPLEQHPGRRAARRGGRGQARTSRRCSSSRCGGCWPTRGREALVTNFAAQWLHLRNLDVDHAGHAPVPGLRRQPAAGVPARDRAVLRQHPARGSQRARPAAARTTRSSTSGWRSTTASRTSTAAASAASRSTTDSWRGGLLRQGSILTVTSYATRTSPVLRGKWVLDNLLGTPPPPPPPDVPALKDNTVDGNLSVRERLAEHRSNPVCAALPQADGSGRACRSRTSTRSAAGGRSRTATPIDASGGLPDGSKFADVDGLEAALLRRPELFVGTLHREAADLRARPGRRVLRRAGRPRDRARGAGAGLPLLVAHPRRREQRAVPDEEVAMIITKKALPRRTFLRGMGATLALPLLDAMVPSMTALAKTPADAGAPPGLRLHADGLRHRRAGRRRAKAG